MRITSTGRTHLRCTAGGRARNSLYRRALAAIAFFGEEPQNAKPLSTTSRHRTGIWMEGPSSHATRILTGTSPAGAASGTRKSTR